MTVRIRGIRHIHDYTDPGDPRIAYTICGQRYVRDNTRAEGAPDGRCGTCLLKQKPDDPEGHPVSDGGGTVYPHA